MSVQIESEIERTDNERRERKSSAKEAGAEDTQELKITVRKLEVPVRPRGVLAE